MNADNIGSSEQVKKIAIIVLTAGVQLEPESLTMLAVSDLSISSAIVMSPGRIMISLSGMSALTQTGLEVATSHRVKSSSTQEPQKTQLDKVTKIILAAGVKLEARGPTRFNRERYPRNTRVSLPCVSS